MVIRQLVFIQVSITAYSKHNANLNTLLSENKGSKNYKELAGDDAPPAMFEYYQKLASKIGTLENILYIYASPKTCYNKDARVFEVMSKHSQHKCVVGLLNESDFFEVVFNVVYIIIIP